MKKTTLRKPVDCETRWVILDANEKVVGRLASRIAMLLMGKHRPDYTPSFDCGDGVVVVNCEKVVFTGEKWDKKIYRRHSGYIGGLKEVAARKVLSRHPDRILYQAVKRMLPKGKLGEKMIKKLKIYGGSGHPHAAQKPEPLVL
ncbi:MAG: 50S ribosomal protein L13 [Planctomycetota bacterium]|nr:50S ribosomal protein L13 [Planctomycetota bacterium]